jgi:hypothetical protein
VFSTNKVVNTEPRIFEELRPYAQPALLAEVVNKFPGNVSDGLLMRK